MRMAARNDKSKKEAWGTAIFSRNKMFPRALRMMIPECLTAINLNNCEIGAIIYVMTVH